MISAQNKGGKQSISSPTQEMIDRLAANYPTATMVNGEKNKVDRVGLLFPYRQWPVAEPPCEREVERAIAWLNNRVVAFDALTKHPRLNSYGLKHLAERWARQYCPSTWDNNYVANGALIVAAEMVGVRMRPIECASVNVATAISASHCRKLREAEQGGTL